MDDDGREYGFWGRCWPITTRILTCWVPGWALRKCGGMADVRVQGAWREKVSLCLIVVVLCLALGFLTFGFTTVVCRPPAKPVYRMAMVEQANTKSSRWYTVHGHIFNIPASYKPYVHKQLTFDPYRRFATKDISAYFPYAPSCMSLGVTFKCRAPGSTVEFCHKPSSITGHDHVGEVAYDWEDVERPKRQVAIRSRSGVKTWKTTLFVFNGAVYDLGQYLEQVPEQARRKPFGQEYDKILRSVIGKDASKQLAQFDSRTLACIDEMFRVGVLQVKTIGCIATDIILYVSLVAILSLVLAKFFLAVGFAFLMARRLGRKRKGDKQKLEPGSADLSNQTAPVQAVQSTREMAGVRAHSPPVAHGDGLFVAVQDSTNSNKMYTILLVTCYSEGEVGLRTTLDSLTESDYPDDQKLLFVIADGIITGSGNGRSTPDILIDMMDRSEERKLFPPYYFDANGQPEAHSYIAIADGSKRHNMARVYAGWYRSGGHRVPMIVVVKCGTPEEANAAKPGNRGKRDSQIILMSFLSKVLFDDRMTPLEFDLFGKIKAITGVSPDAFELVLMVDADTQVDAEAVDKLSCAMRYDPLVMGLCGETQIANATHSWVTAIQVFEYYISHHLSKAFESIFGGVTCLPGCFCMYRIKAPKWNGSEIDGVQWVPILASPDIVDQYSENVTNTLHKKNLLLLGEDRYLTTLMLKTFPKRKMLFVPQALCRTIVPDTFRVLLSQRRRWINSTVHNLFELVLVPDLCGTFCCSMQFVIFMELVGTLVLPAAIVFTGVLITSAFVRKPEWIPLGLLAAILGLPALLILFTTKHPSYIFWFLCYIIALPLWNFVLPVYAFWHFDDFSWGETRKVTPLDGGPVDNKQDDHGLAHGRFDHSQIILKRWHEYEQERCAKLERFMAGVNALGGASLQ